MGNPQPIRPGVRCSWGHTDGMDATLTFTVTDADTASAVGSGSLPVLGTPRLLAWFEAATCAAIEPTLTARQHQRRDPGCVGAPRGLARRRALTVSASDVYVDGRLVRFVVSARQEDGKLVGSGEVTRVVVDTEKFLSRLT